jgi:pyruvate,orthophosphate dikinase
MIRFDPEGHSMADLEVLQSLRLKGRAQPAALAAATAIDLTEVESAVASLTDRGCVEPAGNLGVKLTEDGRNQLNILLESERASIDPEAVALAYEDFCEHNAEFKQLMHDWQIRDGEPNDHSDDAYDAAIVDRLNRIHANVVPVLSAVCQQVPRLSIYERRLVDALEKVCAGDRSWIARPLADSYHTVWFELHEELIGAAGLNRLEEAQAGRAH